MPVEQAGDQRGARHPTVFYADRAYGLETDLSQYGQDLVDGTVVWYESATTRMAGTGRRTLRFRWASGASDSGALWRHGTGAATEALRQNAATQEFEVIVNNVIRASWRPPSIYPDPAQVGRLAWVTIFNPQTTGASDAMLSVLIFENEATGGRDHHAFTHPQKTATVATAYFGAVDSGGTLAYTGTLLAFGYDRDVATLSTLAHDWGAVVPDPPAADEGLTVRQLPPLPFASGAGSAGEFFGLAAQWGAASHHRHRRRSLSPLVNERFATPATWNDSGGGLTAPVPDGSGFHYHTSFLRRRLVSLDANVAWVRAHFNVYNVSGVEDVEVAIRCYSFDAHPLSPQLGDIRYIETSAYVSDSAEHVFERLLTLARRDGETWLALAMLFDPSATAVAVENTRAVVSDWHAAQRSVVADDGALPFGGFG